VYNISKALIAAAISTLFSMKAMAAEIATPANSPSGAGPGTSQEERLRNQQETRKEMLDYWKTMSPKEREQVRNKMKEHWKNLTPEEQEARRNEMREHFKNMSPQERRQFQHDMGKTDDMLPPVDDLPGGSNGAASTIK
jgi:Protein of unknown function (DUF3106)